MTTEMERLIKLAGTAARRYKALCWWADEDELRQEAQWAILRAMRTFDPNRGTPIEAYCWSAAVRWLKGVVLRASAPVSAGWDNLDDLKGLFHAPIEDALTFESKDQSPEELVIDIERHADLMREIIRVGEVAKAEEYVRFVLGGESRPRKIAAERGVPIIQVNHEQQRFVYHAQRSEALKNLWEDSQ